MVRIELAKPLVSGFLLLTAACWHSTAAAEASCDGGTPIADAVMASYESDQALGQMMTEAKAFMANPFANTPLSWHQVDYWGYAGDAFAMARYASMIERSNRLLLESLPTETDPDGGGQSLTGESLTSPVTCHGVVVGSGNATHVEIDFEGSSEMPLSLIRGYNKAIGMGIFGSKWSSSLDYRVFWQSYTRRCRTPEEPISQEAFNFCADGLGPPNLILSRPGGVEMALKQVVDDPTRYVRGNFWARELKDGSGVRTGWEVHTEDDMGVSEILCA